MMGEIYTSLWVCGEDLEYRKELHWPRKVSVADSFLRSMTSLAWVVVQVSSIRMISCLRNGP